MLPVEFLAGSFIKACKVGVKGVAAVYFDLVYECRLYKDFSCGGKLLKEGSAFLRGIVFCKNFKGIDVTFEKAFDFFVVVSLGQGLCDCQVFFTDVMSFAIFN